MATNRETFRDGLQTNIQALTGLASEVVGGVTYTHVWNDLPNTFGGLSPCVTIENGGWRPALDLDSTGITSIRYVIGFWRRIDTRDNAEDALDLFAKELVTMFENKYNARYYQESMPFYEILEGVDYRGEFHFIEIDAV